jgi:hypothetical protein
MHFIAISLIVQIACAVHCIRNGRNGLWLLVIFFLSIPGCIAYGLFEILPQHSGRREVRAMKAATVRRLDPERDVRAAREALDITDTAANRTALADALAASGEWSQALTHYRQALDKTPLGDRAVQLNLARAELQSGDAAAARSLLEGLPPSASASENDRSSLLLARALQECGEAAEALALYADLGTRMAGGEALCRQAALLIAEGRQAEAVPVLAEVESRARRLDRFQRAQDAQMYDWAEQTLAELRAG